MISRPTSVAVLGASALTLGTLLARPARGDAGAPARQQSEAILAARVASAITALPQPMGAAIPTTRLVVAANCPASHVVVRVLLRRVAHHATVPPLVILTDRSWPTLDSLRYATASTLQQVTQPPQRIGVTPAAVTTNPAGSAPGATTSLGVHQVLAHLAPLPPARP